MTGLAFGLSAAMLGRLLVLFISVPLVELVLLMQLANYTSLPFTIALVIVTGVVGAGLARRQGWQTYQRIRQELAAGQMPTNSLVDAAMIFVAGALLLTPGVLTDLFGLSLLFPVCRRFYQRIIIARFRDQIKVHSYSADRVRPQDKVIDSYVVKHDEEP